MCVKIHQQLKLFFLEKQQKTQELFGILSKQYDVPSCVFPPRMSSVSGLSKQFMKKTQKISSFSNVSSKLCLGLSSDEIPFSNTNQIHTHKKKDPSVTNYKIHFTSQNKTILSTDSEMIPSHDYFGA